MAKTNKKASKKATKKAPKPAEAPKKKRAPSQKVSSGTGSARSAARGGSVPEERYAKDPESVAARLVEKMDKAIVQASNAVVRAETSGNESSYVKKLQTAIGHFEAAKKALA